MKDRDAIKMVDRNAAVPESALNTMAPANMNTGMWLHVSYTIFVNI